MIRIGIAGAGFIGTIHAYALARLRDAGLVDGALTAVFDIEPARADRLTRHHGGRAVPTLDALLDAVDAVWCCSWTGAHLEIVSRAADAGLPVFCEKPLGRDLREAEQVAAHLARVPHRVGLVLRCSPVFVRLQEELRSEEHGPPLAVVFRDDQYFPDHGIYRSAWRADPERAGSGTLLEHSIHDVDLLCELLGTPQSVVACTACRTGRPVEDVAAVMLHYPDGALAQLTSVWHDVTARESTRHLEILCERAVLTTDDDTVGPLVVDRADRRTVVECPPPPWTERAGVGSDLLAAMAAYVIQAREVVDDLAAGGPLRGPDAAAALRAHAVVDAAYRSAATGHPVALGAEGAL